MKTIVVFIIISIAFVKCEQEFGQRISKINVKKSNSTNKELIKSDSKDLDSHESFKTYEYRLAPIEVLSHQPKVIAEEHTLHELPALSALQAFAPPPKSALPINEPFILSSGSSDNSGQTSKSLYGAQLRPKHYGTDLPIYRDDPKDQFNGYLPVPLKPALPMQEFRSKTDTSDEVVAHTRPVPYASAHRAPYVAPVIPKELISYSLSTGNDRYADNKAHGGYEVDEGHDRHEDYVPNKGYSGYGRHHSHLDYIQGIPGTPWKDYPIYHSIPQTNFKCIPHTPGYYADVESNCQVWHYCQLDGRHDRFLCSNGTMFNQKTRVCDWWYNVHCPSSVDKYGVNDDLYRQPMHQKYLPKHNPINGYGVKYHDIPVPISYQGLNDLHDSGHGLVYAESQTVPQKQLIKRVRKVKLNVNKSNSTETRFLTKQSTQ